MEDLKAGMQIMHNARAVELLYLIATIHKNGQPVCYFWKAKLLFVQPEETVEQILEGDMFSHLHTEKKHEPTGKTI